MKQMSMLGAALSDNGRRPTAVLAAALISIVAALGQTLFGDVALALELVALGFSIVLAVLLVRGSVLAWILLVAGALVQVVFDLFGSGPLWLAICGISILVLLLTKSVRKFSFAGAPPRQLRRTETSIPIADQIIRIPLLAEELSSRIGRKAVIRTFLGTLALFVVVGVVGTCRKEAQPHNAAWDLAWNIVFSLYKLSLLLLVLVLLVALSQSVGRKARRGG